jgi:outer membrane immunogenic protein
MAPYYSWTGFYIGGNIGYSVGSDRASGVLSVPNFKETSSPDTAIVPFGAIGGGQLGYNWQGGSNWLVGFEADFQGSGQKGTSCVVGCINAPSAALLQTFTARHTLDYFGTVRGRFGFVNNDALFYVTGGGVYGRVNQTLEARQSLAGVGTLSAGSTIENKFGFVVGAGLEASLGGNWTGKIEYLYMDLGSTGTGLAGTVPGVPVTPFTFTASSTIRDNIVRAGLNYRFGEPGAPLNALAADYPMPAPATSHVYSWTGFYVGANVGYGFGNDRDLMSEPIGTTPVTSEPGSSITPKGVIGGVQLGYNWQGSPNWLVGFEADLQGSAQTDTACGPIICLNQTAAGGAGGSAQFNTLQQQIDYFGTLRGRLGAVKDSVVYYVTGGAAFGHVRQSVNATATGVGLFVSGASSAEMIGWTVGGGIEAALWGNWTAKAEYLYMNLGSISTSVDVSTPGAPGTLATNSTVRDHVVRIGANYHFDTGSGAITARY